MLPTRAGNRPGRTRSDRDGPVRRAIPAMNREQGLMLTSKRPLYVGTTVNSALKIGRTWHGNFELKILASLNEIEQF